MFGLDKLTGFAFPFWAKALAVAALAAAIFGAGYYVRDLSADLELSTYIFNTEKAAYEAQAKSDQLYIDQLKLNAENAHAYNTGLATLRGELYRVRLTRPDGSRVPTISAPAGGVSGASRECVPLEDYKALEGRAARDAFLIQSIQERDERLNALYNGSRQ